MMWRAGDTLLTNQVPGTWNDAPIDLSTSISSQFAWGVAEAVPEPSCLAALAFGGLALLVRRRTQFTGAQERPHPN
jgi:hypothetical protein